eukprot:CAMPEP_0198253348 /NCGR_PEP_ID=MMETSP1447-20131203/3800_1 /TAXON_ID=420782 /ORGANISM="Chaetoceros dichaeta, Strain CCMP1751" /LENGTH=56 /DNA_ID=CAMNT_0043938993 /DNA_START=108 /DNA_END=275 /DNA_ORIENTATION=+
MKHVATYLLLVLGGNDSPSASDVTDALTTVGVEGDSAAIAKLVADMDGKSLSEMLE